MTEDKNAAFDEMLNRIAEILNKEAPQLLSKITFRRDKKAGFKFLWENQVWGIPAGAKGMTIQLGGNSFFIPDKVEKK